MTKAQRFNVGYAAKKTRRLEGTVEESLLASVVPSGLQFTALDAFPNVETLGYFRMSLRDGDFHASIALCSSSIRHVS